MPLFGDRRPPTKDQSDKMPIIDKEAEQKIKDQMKALL